MIIHGNADSTVPYKQSEKLYQTFQNAGVKSQFITVEGGGHGKFGKEKDVELALKIIEFLTSLDIFKK
jgi:dipeptidyl aminopeptidase/acylaminoacyl peptidase